jgi:hypothetical protein
LSQVEQGTDAEGSTASHPCSLLRLSAGMQPLHSTRRRVMDREGRGLASPTKCGAPADESATLAEAVAGVPAPAGSGGGCGGGGGGGGVGVGGQCSVGPVLSLRSLMVILPFRFSLDDSLDRCRRAHQASCRHSLTRIGPGA